MGPFKFLLLLFWVVVSYLLFAVFFVVVLVDYSAFCSTVCLRLALGGRNSVT